MFRSLMSSWPLFFGLLLIMIGNGLLVFLLGVRASAAGFSTTISGLMMGGSCGNCRCPVGQGC